MNTSLGWRLGASVLLLSTLTRAGNDEGIPLGDDAALTGNSVAAMVSDGSSLFYNPGGLGAAKRNQVDVSASMVLLRLYRVPRFLSTTDGAASNGSYTEFVSVPSAVSFVRALAPDIKLGFGLFVPATSAWNVDASLVAGDNTFHLTSSTRESIYHAIVGVGWAVDPRLSLGVSLSGVYDSGLTSGAAWAGYGGGGASDMFIANSRLFAVTALGATLAIGAQWQLLPGWRTGLSIRAPTVTFHTSVSGSLVAGQGAVSPPFAGVQSVDVDDDTSGLHQLRSLQGRFGIARTWGTSWISIEAEMQPGVSDEAIGTERRALWNVRGGALLALGDHQWLGCGVFTDRSGEDRPSTTLDSRIDFYGVSLGLRLDDPHLLAASERPQDVVFSTTIAARYAYGSGQRGSVAFESDPSAGVIAVSSVADAEVHELGIYLGSSLYF